MRATNLLSVICNIYFEYYLRKYLKSLFREKKLTLYLLYI